MKNIFDRECAVKKKKSYGSIYKIILFKECVIEIEFEGKKISFEEYIPNRD